MFGVGGLIKMKRRVTNVASRFAGPMRSTGRAKTLTARRLRPWSAVRKWENEDPKIYIPCTHIKNIPIPDHCMDDNERCMEWKEEVKICFFLSLLTC